MAHQDMETPSAVTEKPSSQPDSVHPPEDTRAILNRLARTIGHLQSVRRMVEDGRDCADILIQLAAVRSAIDSTSKQLIHSHLNHCIVDAVHKGDQDSLELFYRALDRYLS